MLSKHVKPPAIDKWLKNIRWKMAGEKKMTQEPLRNKSVSV